jgi:hypothetical protein
MVWTKIWKVNTRTYSSKSQSFPFPLCNWQRRIWQSVESREEKHEGYFGHERNEQSQNI